MQDIPRVGRAFVLVVLACVVAGCWSKRMSVPQLARLYDYDRPSRLQPSPVVLMSGFLGSSLVDLDSGRVIWGEFGTGALMIHKPEVQRRLAIPMVGGDTLAELRDQVVPKEPMIIAQLSIVGWKVKLNAYPGNIIGILVRASKPADEKGGVSKRNLHRHARDMESYESAGLYGFAYDWRRDLSEAVLDLDAVVRRAHQEALSRGLDKEAARVDILTHSMGCLVARYYLRYGTQPLPDDGSLPELDWRGAALVRRAILLAPPNGGALAAVKTAAFGGRPIAFFPEFPGPVVGTYPSIYQLMPRPASNALVYADDRSSIDLYDSEVWARYGWGLLEPGYDKLLANLIPGGSPAQRRVAVLRFLKLALARAKQLHEALDVPARPPDGTTLHLFASDTHATAGHATIDRATGKLLEVQREPGDGVVTRRSALHDLRRDPHQRERVDSPVVWSSVHFVEGNHLRMTGTPLVGDDLLYLLLQAPK